MESKNMSIEEFLFYYKRQITELRISLSTTIQSILNTKSNSIVDIALVSSGTCIMYVNERVVNGNFVDFKESIRLQIGYQELLHMYENSNYSLFDAFNKLVTHEFLHVLFGDFTTKKLNQAYNYANGSLKEENENDPYYLKQEDTVYDNKGYEKIDHEMYNIASDFVINRELDITEPFMRAESFDLDPDLNVFQYYSILMNDEETRTKIEMKLDPLAFVLEDITGDDPNANLSSIPISNEAMTRVTDEELLEDLFLGKGRSFGPSCIDFVIKALKKKKSIFFDETKHMINQIKEDLFNNQDTPSDYEECWTKLNNRKDEYDDIVVPGKTYVPTAYSNDSEEKTLPIIFVDCSGSMLDILKELFYFLYNILTFINCTVVFYDTTILKVINSANSLNFDPSMFLGGGTSVKSAIEEYKENYNNGINNIYIFTDGEDDFTDIDVKYVNIYKFSKTGVSKIDI